MTLVKGDLRTLVRARRLSTGTMRNLRQNLFFAFAYKIWWACRWRQVSCIRSAYSSVLCLQRRHDLQLRIGHLKCAPPAACTIESVHGLMHVTNCANVIL